MASGYSHHQTKNIIQDGLIGYESLVKKVEKGEAVLHRSANEGAGPRKRKKLLGKGNWFTLKKRHTSEKLRQSKLKKPMKGKKKEEERDYTTVLFVSQTPNGILAKQLQKVENVISKLTGDRVKVVERGGTSIKKILVKSNPWAGALCGRENCLPCMFGSEENQDCFSKGVVYDMTCTICEEEAKDRNDLKIPIYRYTGTTSRSLHERGAEHLKAFKDGDNDKSVMLKHSLDKHGGHFVPFKMKVIKKHFSAFHRLVHEAVRIDRGSRDPNISSLNSKSEFGRGNLPRLIIDEAKVGLKTSSLENDEQMTVLKIKEKNDVTETEDSSKVDPSIDNTNLNIVLFENFDTPLTAAEENQMTSVGRILSADRKRLTRHNIPFLVKLEREEDPVNLTLKKKILLNHFYLT